MTNNGNLANGQHQKAQDVPVDQSCPREELYKGKLYGSEGERTTRLPRITQEPPTLSQGSMSKWAMGVGQRQDGTGLADW